MTSKIYNAIVRHNLENSRTQENVEDDFQRPQRPRRTMPEAHLSDYLDILKRRKWIIILCFVLIVGAVTAVSFYMTPEYEATTQILLGGQPTLMNPLGDGTERLPERSLNYKTHVNLLSNRSLARKVIAELELEKIYPSIVGAQPLLPDANAKHSNDAAEQKTIPPTNDKEAYVLNAEVLDWYLRRLTVTPVRDSSLVNVSFRGPDKHLITRIVNEHAQTATETAVHRHQSLAEDALDWLKTQIESQKKEVQSAERAIYNFKKLHNALSLEDTQIINSQEIRELSSALTRAKSERIAKQTVYLQLKNIARNKKDIMSMPEISNYSVIENLRNQLVDLNSRKMEMGTQYGPKHPKMMELTNRIHQIKNETQMEVSRLKNTIKAELDRAATIEKSIARALNKQKKVAMSLGERAIEYEVLKQQAESSQDIYNFLLKQSEEIGLATAISSSNMRIVDKAELPVKPVSPKIKLNILLAIFLSLFTGTGLAFFLEYLDNTVKTPMDVAIQLDLPVLGMIPFQKALQNKNHNIALLEDNTKRAGKEMIPNPLYHISNRLPAELRKPAQGLFGRALIVESVTMAEGKSTVVAQIAANLTNAGLRVLLVDCDFQRPSLDKLLNVSNGGGLGKSINRIMAHNLSTGTLDKYSVDDLFFLIALKKKSGHLLIKNEDQTYIVHFQNGVLIHIQNANSPENNRIGTMLLNGGFITKDQLNDALRRHKRTGQPLGYILVNAGYIGREKLRGPLRLQIEEYIQKLFSWKKGHFSFKPGIIHIYENEKIFFDEDYGPLINNLGRIESSNFIGKELFSHIKGCAKENLYLLPAGTSYKLIGSLNQVLMKKIFEKLKQHFDVLLIDTPPLDAASGIEAIFPLADAMVLVIKAGHLSVKNLNGAINHLPQDKIIGTVLNQAKIDPQPYYY
jgi:uncharacterized protein involved in exopolysaccharide biosynthesis/Mrp family chromosome partitioning ATPase